MSQAQLRAPGKGLLGCTSYRRRMGGSGTPRNPPSLPRGQWPLKWEGWGAVRRPRGVMRDDGVTLTQGVKRAADPQIELALLPRQDPGMVSGSLVTSAWSWGPLATPASVKMATAAPAPPRAAPCLMTTQRGTGQKGEGRLPAASPPSPRVGLGVLGAQGVLPSPPSILPPTCPE